MRGVSKRVVEFAGIFVIITTLLVQPVMAASNLQGVGFGALIKRLVAHILDTTQISLPPG